jgi:hypothetical protein
LTEKKEKEEKVFKPLDIKDYKDQMDKIVDQMVLMAGAREVVTEHVNYLAGEYGLKKPDVRAAATAIFKDVSKEEVAEKSAVIVQLIETFNK